MDIASVIKQITGKTPLCLEDYKDEWYSWYSGDVKDFHNYTIRTSGDTYVDCRRKTLNMAKKVCEDWANLLLNEKTDVAIAGEQDQAELNRLLNDVRFWTKGNDGVEKAFALGNGAFVESVDGNGRPNIQFVNRTKIYPLTIEDDRITECAFVNTSSKDVVIQCHYKGEDGKYIIKTAIGDRSGEDIIVDFANPDKIIIFETGAELPWFQMVKPNIANNININSPMGISVFANALNVLEGIDLAYDGFCDEMQLGKARIFVNSKLVHRDETGEHKVFDNRDVAFYVYQSDNEDIKEPMKFYNPSLRSAEFYTGINNTLNLLSSKVGFGENHYKFDGGSISTATQVVSENSEMFRTLKKHEIILNDVIIGAVRALIYICNTFGNNEYRFSAGALESNLEVKFDDSIVEDKETQKLNDRQDVNMGVMSKAEYRSKWYNEDLETAQKSIDEITDTNSRTLTNFFSEE